MSLEQPAIIQREFSRVLAVDVVRGLVMIVMTLDHARDYLVSGNPSDLATTTPALFYTRWITHFCAPAFVFLAGVSADLSSRRRGLSKSVLARRLIVRGLGLAAIDVVLMPAIWWFNFDFRLVPLAVLWAIGWSMVMLACCLWMDKRWIGAVGAVIILSHNLFDGVRFESGSPLHILWCVLHEQNGVQLFDSVVIVSAYPLVPWIGVLFLGYAMGGLVECGDEPSRRRLFYLGAGLTVAFIVLRATNLYGDMKPWALEETASFTVLSFLNCTKYPPSLCFLLMTLGPILMLLSLIRPPEQLWMKPVTLLGRAPLFFYLLHIAIVHLVGIGFSLWRYGRADWWFQDPPLPTMPEDYGWSLGVLYLVWACVIAALIPICWGYQELKRGIKGKTDRRKEDESQTAA